MEDDVRVYNMYHGGLLDCAYERTWFQPQILTLDDHNWNFPDRQSKGIQNLDATGVLQVALSVVM